MKYEFEYNLVQHGTDYLLLSGKGAVNAKQFEHVYQNVFDFAKSANVYRLLVDARQFNLSYPMDHFIPLMKNVAPYLRQLKTARVIKEDSLHQSMIETISHNSGFNLKNFDCRTEAINWLMQD